MKIYKRKDIIEIESQNEDECDQLNWLFGLLSSRPVKWTLVNRDGKKVLLLSPKEQSNNNKDGK